jgi:hypothetical protein
MLKPDTSVQQAVSNIVATIKHLLTSKPEKGAKK